MNDIDLKSYKIDGMNIQDIMSHTSMGNLNLKDLYLYLKNRFKLYTKDKTKREYIINNMEEWERNLILNGILAGEVIENNMNRPCFRRDRSFCYNGKTYNDEFLTTLWVAVSKVFEEYTTLAFINNIKFDGKFSENPKAPKVNDVSCINSEPDFIWTKEDGSTVMVEQKCSYVENFSIKIRAGQMKNFEMNYNDNIVILVKIETQNNSDVYYFYDYKDIKPYLKQNVYGGNVKYYVTKKTLSEHNILPLRVLIDQY